MSTLVNMPEAVTLPVFGSTSAAAQPPAQGDGLQVDVNEGDQMDFDLLAEYLLDDAPGNAGGITFDFA